VIGARDRSRERLGDRVVRHVPATTGVRVDRPPEQASVAPPDLVEVVGLHSVTLTERSEGRKVNRLYGQPLIRVTVQPPSWAFNQTSSMGRPSLTRTTTRLDGLSG
jgi:hypothetical protein